ncbi:MAG TPA: hypothetical protein VN656_08535 [Stellaceae bacterium]|jgi:hypothetical protein|nr:hypothetical protein [Stellaceae bacterium]
MGRSLYLIVLLGLLSGCVPIAIDPGRDQFGVSTARPVAAEAPPSDQQLAELDRKAQAICTTGYQGAAPTVQPAANSQQIVDQKLRCSHYDRLNLDYVHMDWSNIF